MAVFNMNNGDSGNGTLDADLIIGTNGADKIFGNYGDDVLQGNGGNDTFLLTHANGWDFFDGGDGYDRIYVDHSTTAHFVIESFVQINSITSVEEIASDGVRPTHIVVAGTADFTNTKLVNILDIRGTAANNSIIGSAQNDKIFGYEGNDTLNGGLGADTMVGGVGNDTYFVDNAGDIVTEDANAGTDMVYSSIGHALSANVENLALLGTASVNGIGNALDNVIQGNAGNNLIGGNEGNDILAGGDGNDQLVGGPGNDYLQGDKGNDTLVGNDGVDRLFGGAGSDLLAGQAGNDELTGGSEADQFYFNLGGGQDTVRDFQDGIDKFTLGKDIKNISVFVSNGSAALDLYDAASSTPHTYVLLQGIQASQIDSSDFLWA